MNVTLFIHQPRITGSIPFFPVATISVIQPRPQSIAHRPSQVLYSVLNLAPNNHHHHTQ
ncbi:hypothetical protein BDZ45DRAFT_673807 [Acephala macrosclerotiorum]|nr:hypothetical protein BDZ45DRAFT_673807 [Acephala macrosclerotiorum]